MGKDKKENYVPVKGSEKVGSSSKIACLVHGCKDSPYKYEFCKEHFDQFKFGLIKKDGYQVPDYDKKYDHYLKWKKLKQVA
jgi:hypothetical protein